MRLVLASASPRRAELLRAAAFTFEVIPADVDETPRGGEAGEIYALRVAREKAAVVERVAPTDAVLAADTIVQAGDRVLGKPVDRADAARMLALLSGTTHLVRTAVVLRSGGQEVTAVETTRVSFVALSPAEIEWYVATGEPDGKAGAYAIQGIAARFVDSIEGSWSNVVGLPIARVHRILRDAGIT